MKNSLFWDDTKCNVNNMTQLSKLLILPLILGCGQIKTQKKTTTEAPVVSKNTVDASGSGPLQPLFSKARFDSLHSWDFGWAILEPINIAKNEEDEKLLSKRFTPGQKALYYFWYLDAEVTNGGFIQFYWNGYGKYLPSIMDGLKLIGDSSMLNLVIKADKEYTANRKKFNLQREKEDWSPLYNNLKKFEEYDHVYYATHDKTMDLIEKYAREHASEFVKFE